jgi:hypothetical protein
MKKVESIWAELSAKAQEVSKEVELTEEQVELASVGELEKQITDMKRALDYFDKRIAEGDTYIKELIKYRNFSLDVYSKLSKITPKMQEGAQKKLDEFEKAAKELGLSSNNVPQVKEIKRLISETEKSMQDQKSLLKRFNQQGIK